MAAAVEGRHPTLEGTVGHAVVLRVQRLCSYGHADIQTDIHTWSNVGECSIMHNNNGECSIMHNNNELKQCKNNLKLN